ncbi:DUF5372 family protein [Streptomyces sp. NPDC094438]|uniref:DUF5372 family protein n=1 Tax=Streptomyces sp. NPDC094438 TaxID=3366061 RepID=UPI00380BBF45
MITHPFHPWHGRSYEFVVRRRNWGEDRVCFHDETGRVVSVPTSWTDVADEDPFVVMAAGRCPFRLGDLLRLAGLLDQLASRPGDVGRLAP